MDQKDLKRFETKVRGLILKYQDLKKDVDAMQQEIVVKDLKIHELNEQLAQQQEDYQNLKTAKMMTLTDEDVAASRQRITNLVREVNKCINLLTAEGTSDARG